MSAISLGKHLQEFYPQDGGESQPALKLRHCHPMYSLLSESVVQSCRSVFLLADQCNLSLKQRVYFGTFVEDYKVYTYKRLVSRDSVYDERSICHSLSLPHTQTVNKFKYTYIVSEKYQL